MSMRPLRPSGPSPALARTHPPAVVKQKACIPCRKRKVKCDRKNPCTNCASWDLECVSPSPIRTCTRPKRKVSSCPLSTAVTEDGVAVADERAVCMRDTSQSVDARLHDLEKALQEMTEALEQAGLSKRDNEAHGLCHSTQKHTRHIKRLEEIETRMRELKSRRDKVKFFGFEPSSPPTSAFSNSSSFIPQNINADPLFPFNSFSVEVAPLRPLPAQSRACWQMFLENVDQLVKVLYKPSAEKILQNVADGSCSLSKGQEALLLTIHFSSIISMTEQDAKACFQMSKSTALMTYRSASEQALMRADFLTTHDLTTLQAFVLFLSFNLYVDDAKLVWALTGLARRLCCSSSVTKASHSPFEREMHRRLWWQLWFLDRRASEDQGRENTAGSPPDGTIDPELPLNINDTDLASSARALPQSKGAWTEMSFSLIRYKIARTSRNITGDKSHILYHEKENMINDCVSKIQSRYLRHCDGSHPIHWIAQHVSYVTVTELWIQLHDQIQDCYSFTPSLDSIQINQMTQINRRQLFFASIDIVDVSRRLRTEPSGHKWKWLLKAYLQFHPLKFLLAELCRRLNETQESLEADFNDTNERARRVASFAFTRWTDENKKTENGQIVCRLMSEAKEAWKAREERERIKAQIRSAPAVDWNLSLEAPVPAQDQVDGVQSIQNAFLELGGIPAPLPAQEFSTELNAYNNLSWSMGNQPYPSPWDGSVSYYSESGDVLEEVYSF